VAYMKNIDSGAIIGPIADDSAEYLYLQGLMSSQFPNDPLFEDVGSAKAGVVAAPDDPDKYTVQAVVPSVTATNDGGANIGEAAEEGSVTNVEYFPADDVTGADSPDSRTVSLLNGSATIATLALVDGADLSKDVSNEIPVSTTPADVAVAEGDLLTWGSLAKTGSGGLADPGGLVIVTITRG
jgi:hypothetical protein